MDYDGAGAAPVTPNKSINLSPDLEPGHAVARVHVVHAGYPVPLPRCSRSRTRPMQLLAGFLGINSSPAFSPDGKSWP